MNQVKKSEDEKAVEDNNLQDAFNESETESDDADLDIYTGPETALFWQ